MMSDIYINSTEYRKTIEDFLRKSVVPEKNIQKYEIRRKNVQNYGGA